MRRNVSRSGHGTSTHGSTDSTRTLSSDYVFYSWILSKDPSGADWLAATINADEFGQKLIA